MRPGGGAAGCGLRAAGCGLRAAGCGLRGNHPGARAGSLRNRVRGARAFRVRSAPSWGWVGGWLALGPFGGAGRDGCHRLVVARPLRGRGLCLVLRIRCCPSTTWSSLPSTASLARGRGRSAAWRRAVGLVCGWSRVRSAGPGRDSGHRLVAARPLRGRGLCLVLRIRCCPSTTWPLPPWSASPDSRSGAVVRGASGCSAAAQAFGPRWGWVAGVAVRKWSAVSGSWVGCVSGAWVFGMVRGLFCLVVPRFRLGEHETRTRRPARTRAPGKAAGQASSRGLGVSSGSGFGPEERVGAGVGCETRHGHRPPGAAAGTTAHDRESGDADQGSDGHVVDGQQRMRSTKQDPGPGGDEQRRDGGHPHDPAPPNRPRATTAPAPHHDAQPANRPRPRTREADQGSNGHVVDGQQRMRSTKQRPRPRRGRATTRRRPPATTRPRRTDPGPTTTAAQHPDAQAADRPRPRASKADPDSNGHVAGQGPGTNPPRRAGPGWNGRGAGGRTAGHVPG
ncbi:hypothetical protein ABIA38_002124 [Embleya sp. AB8]